MKTKYLDNEIERLNLMERTEDLSDYGQEMLNEFRAIKQALTIPDAVKSLNEKEEITFLDWIKQEAMYLGSGIYLYKDKEYTFTELSQIYDSQHQL